MTGPHGAADWPRARLLGFGAIAALLLLAALALGVGPGDIGVLQAWEILLSPAEATRTQWVVVWDLRLPRILLAGLLGGALGVAGVVTQGLFRNPLAEPSVLGVNLGAAVAAVLGFTLGLDQFGFATIPILAGLGAIATLLILFVLSGRSRDGVTLLLSGVAISSLAAAIITLLLAIQVERWELGLKVLSWLMGSFEGRSWTQLLWGIPPIILGLGAAAWLHRDLDLLHLGPDTATSLGLSMRRTHWLAVGCIGLLVGSATALAGVIGFVGLVVPHVTRLLWGPSHRRLLPASLLIGAGTLIAVDLITRAMTSVVLPPGVITSLLGGPFFLWLLQQRGRSAWS